MPEERIEFVYEYNNIESLFSLKGLCDIIEYSTTAGSQGEKGYAYGSE